MVGVGDMVGVSVMVGVEVWVAMGVNVAVGTGEGEGKFVDVKLAIKEAIGARFGVEVDATLQPEKIINKGVKNQMYLRI